MKQIYKNFLNLNLFEKIYIFCILALCFIPIISEIHMFRQSQILITTEYFFEHNNIIYPQIPVFGNDNSYLGFEFPILQYFTYMVTSILPINKIIFLKLLSFLSFIGIYLILNNLLEEYKYKKFFLASYILNPIHIVFVPTVNIEYFSIFVSMVSFYYVASHPKNYLLILFFSVIAALSKIIIFLIFAVPTLMLILNRLDYKKNIRHITALVSIFILCICIFFIWKEWMDVLANNGYFSSKFSSDSLWILGSIEDRLSIRNIIELVIKLIIFVSPISILFLYKIDVKLMVLSVIFMFIFGPLIFIRLHLVHDYYFIYTSVLIYIYMFVISKYTNRYL